MTGVDGRLETTAYALSVYMAMATVVHIELGRGEEGMKSLVGSAVEKLNESSAIQQRSRQYSVERDIVLLHQQTTAEWSGTGTEQDDAVWILLVIENLEMGAEEEVVLEVEHIGQHRATVSTDTLSNCIHSVLDALEIEVDLCSGFFVMRLAPPS